jgi:hypothetical protein
VIAPPPASRVATGAAEAEAGRTSFDLVSPRTGLANRPRPKYLGSCHHVALLTREALRRVGLSPAAKVLDLKGRFRVPRMRKEGAGGGLDQVAGAERVSGLGVRCQTRSRNWTKATLF